MSISEIAATTHNYREQKTADAVRDNNPLLVKMNDIGNILVDNYGKVIWENIYFDQNQKVQSIDAREVIDITYNQTITAFEFSPKINVVPVTIDSLEQAQNQGPMQFKNLLKERLTVADSSLRNKFEQMLQGDGTGSSGKDFAGIKTYVSKTPNVGVIGGLDRASISSIRNVAVEAISQFGTPTDSTNIESRLRFVRNQAVRGPDKPTLCLAGENMYGFAADAASKKQRIIDQRLADLGFDNYIVEGMTMLLANGRVFSGLPRIGANEAYLLTPSTFRLRMYKGFNMEPAADRHAFTQLVDLAIIVAIGNLTMNNPGLNCVFYEVPPVTPP